MSLRHALLAILTAEEMSGYDLVKYFDGTVEYVWSAPHSQIYPELRKMESLNLIAAMEVPRGEKATKRIYSITEDGTRELREWAATPHVLPPERDLARLKATYGELAGYTPARRQLQNHLNHWTEVANRFQNIVNDIGTGSVPLLQKRLEGRPEEEWEAIVAFKRFAFQGTIYRAEAEIRWAKEGLALIEQLEAAGAPLTGEAIASSTASDSGRMHSRVHRSLDTG